MIPVLLLFALMQAPQLCVSPNGGFKICEVGDTIAGEGTVFYLTSPVGQPGFSVEPIHKLCDDGKYYLRVTPGTPPVYEEAPCLVMPTSATITIVPAPDPIDVPAIEETVEYNTGVMENCRTVPIKDGVSNVVVCDSQKGTYKRTTCSDKRRILLTSEDGRKHCVLFQQ